jgi:endonuclease/exonuclease/phosphatase family metal-dependent hydrolase
VNGRQLKLVTWNIHRCVGSDGVLSRSRCAGVLREIDADLAVLQEVESTPGQAQDVLAYLADAIGSAVVAGPTIIAGDTHYGNALLSKFPVGAVRHHDLSVVNREPRAALDVDLQLGSCSVQLVATHLGLRPAERRDQVEGLIPLFRSDSRDLVVVAGDLNEWFLWGRPLRRLHRIFPDTPHRRSWPSRWPLFALDRIWVNPRAALHSLAVHKTALSRAASDHLPLVARIELPTSSCAAAYR